MARTSGRRPSKFFLVILPALVVAVLAAALAGDARPVFALRNNLVFRLEVGLAVFAILYVITLLLYLAWYGKAPQQLGGGPATVQTTPQEVDGGEELKVDLGPPTSEQEAPPGDRPGAA